MRQFNFDLTKTIQNGLLKGDRAVRNEPYLSAFSGFQVKDGSAERLKYPNVVEAPGLQYTDNLPLTKLMDSGFFIFESSMVGKFINVEYGTVDTIEMIDSNGDTFIPDPQSYYHIASFLDTWYAFTGDYIYKYNGNKIEVIEKSVTTGCLHKSRILFGGVESNFLQDFNDYIFDIAKNVDVPYVFGDEINSNTIFWTAPQSDDWLRWIQEASSMTTGSNNLDLDTYGTELFRSEIIDVLQRGNTGFYTLPSDCDITKVVSVSENLYVFTDNGLFILSFETIGQVDVLSKRARLPIIVTDEDKIHSNEEGACIFCDDDGYLYSITDKVTKEGYKKVLTPFLDNTWAISYSNYFKGFIISVSSVVKLLWSESVLSSFFSDGMYLVSDGYDEYFYASEIDNTLQDKQIIKTSIIDLNETGQKTITEIHLYGDWDGSAHAFIEWRNHNMKSFKTSPSSIINNQGWCSLRVNAKEFKVGISFKGCTEINIDSFKVSFQADDKRYKRGIDAGSIES